MQPIGKCRKYIIKFIRIRQYRIFIKVYIKRAIKTQREEMNMYKKTLIIVGLIVLVLVAIMIGVVIFLVSKDKSDDDIGNNFNIVDMFDNSGDYVDESRYSKDKQALEAIPVAVMLMVAEPDTDWSLADNKVTTLKSLIDVGEKNNILIQTLQEIFDEDWKFKNSSSAFENVTTKDVYVKVVNGSVYVNVKSRDKDFDDFQDPMGVDLFE